MILWGVTGGDSILCGLVVWAYFVRLAVPWTNHET
jgi:hypothetical protein